MPVLYTRSREIEQRLADLLGLIRKGEGSADELASKLGVSTATIARGIAALRHRGNEISAVRCGTRWRYVVSRKRHGGS